MVINQNHSSPGRVLASARLASVGRGVGIDGVGGHWGVHGVVKCINWRATVAAIVMITSRT